MKKLLTAALVITAAAAVQAGTISWGNTDLDSDQPTGGFVGGELVVLVQDTGLADTFEVAFTGSAGSWAWSGADTLVAGVTANIAGFPGLLPWQFTSSFTSPGNVPLDTQVYTVIFNAATIADSTQYVIMDAGFYTTPSTDIPGTYSATGVGGANTWQAVPEPGTVGLAIAGLVAVVARRRKRK